MAGVVRGYCVNLTSTQALVETGDYLESSPALPQPLDSGFRTERRTAEAHSKASQRSQYVTSAAIGLGIRWGVLHFRDVLSVGWYLVQKEGGTNSAPPSLFSRPVYRLIAMLRAYWTTELASHSSISCWVFASASFMAGADGHHLLRRRRRVTVIPCPSPSLVTAIVPPCASTIAWVMANPRPVPPIPRLRDWPVR